MPANGDVGLVAADGVDQEVAPPMTTTYGTGTTWTATGARPRPPRTFVAEAHIAPAGTPGITAGIGMVPWRGVLAVEGRETGDGRKFRKDSLWWDDNYLPADLFAMLSDPDGGVGHDGSTIAGRIDKMWKQDHAEGYTEVWGEGFYDTSTPTGKEVLRLQQQGMLTGVSVDVDSVETVMPENATGDDLLDMLFGGGAEEYSSGRIRRATVCSIPAFIEARIFPVNGAGSLVASAASEDCAGVRAYTPVVTARHRDTGDLALVASAAGFARSKGKAADRFRSALVDTDPPAEVFARVDYRTYTPFEVDAEGRLSGHVSPWGACHIGFSDRCVIAPRTRCGYAHARTGHVLTAEGDLVPTARVFAQFGPGRGHAETDLGARPAVEWYESMTLAVADVAVYDDEHGIQVQGRLRPGVTRQQVVAVRASRISPDWRTIGGGLECVALAVVNVSGFTNAPNAPALVASAMEAGLALPDPAELVGAAFVVDGEVRTLVASGGPSRDPALALASVVARLAARVEELEQQQLAWVAADLVADLPTEADEQDTLRAAMAAALAGVDLDPLAPPADPDVPGVDVDVVPDGMSAGDLATLRQALAITQRLAGKDTVEAADTMACPNCGEQIAAGSTECPACGWVAGSDDVGAADKAAKTMAKADKAKAADDGDKADDKGGADKTKTCPHCKETVPYDAEKCPECGWKLGTPGGDPDAKGKPFTAEPPAGGCACEGACGCAKVPAKAKAKAARAKTAAA